MVPDDSGRASYINAREATESEGRFKQDSEYCLRRASDPQPVFWDQDYGDPDGDGDIETCNENALYGQPGVKWLNESYVQDHPFTVSGGIDDDYNPFLKQEGHPTLESEPDRNSWNFNSETPVPTGTNQSKVATQGFCGGDDGSEYLATQVCRTDVCVTDRGRFGAGKEPGACTFDGRASQVGRNAQPVNDTRHRRQIYSPGQIITLNYTQPVNITCVDGAWYEEGPITFEREETSVPLNGTTTTGFMVVNLGQLSTEYRVELRQGTEAERFSEFDGETGTSFTVEVPPKQSRRFELQTRGVREFDSSITVTASGVNVDERGTDTLDIETINTGSSPASGGGQQPRNVPGIEFLQVLALVFAAATLFAADLRG